MNRCPISLRHVLAVAGVALSLPLAAQTMPPPDELAGYLRDAMPFCSQGPGGPMPGERGGGGPHPGRGLAGPEGMVPEPAMLRGLRLSESQRDKVFAIVHAQAPTVREKAKAARHAQDDLRALALSTLYDAAKAKALADAAGRAVAELALLQADSHHQIFLVLTDAERQPLELAPPPGRRM